MRQRLVVIVLAIILGASAALATGTMSARFERRLQELRAEYEKGRTELLELKRRQVELESLLLRIRGAIEVLEESLESEGAKSD